MDWFLTFLGLVCETITRHRMGPWTKMEIPENPRLRFEHSQCRFCRQWYIRPQRIDWTLTD